MATEDTNKKKENHLLNLFTDSKPPSCKRVSGFLLILTAIGLSIMAYEPKIIEPLLWAGAVLVGASAVTKMVKEYKHGDKTKDEE